MVDSTYESTCFHIVVFVDDNFDCKDNDCCWYEQGIFLVRSLYRLNMSYFVVTTPTLMTNLFFGNFWVFWEKAILRSLIIPNRSLDRKNAIGNEKPYFLSFCIFLLASCCSFALAVARYAFEFTINHLLNNLMKAVQNLMTDLGLRTTMIIRVCSDWC